MKFSPMIPFRAQIETLGSTTGRTFCEKKFKGSRLEN